MSRQDAAPDPVEPARADVDRWPWLPERPAGLAAPPSPGQWVWYVPEKMRHSSFHEVRSIEVLAEDGEPPLDLVVVTCGRAWPLGDLAAVVDGLDPVLRRSADGVGARCANCASGGHGRANFWIRRLRETGALETRRDRGR